MNTLQYARKKRALFVHDNLSRVVLEVRNTRGRTTTAGGIRYGGIGRVIHVNTVPNEHTLNMVARFIKQPDD